jgi:hypothetical protein
MSEKELMGRFIVDKIHIVLENMGIKSGLPESSNFLDYSKLDYKSYRIANRIQIILSKNNVNTITPLIESYIKTVDIEAKGKINQVQYISADDLNKVFKEFKIARELDLPEKLNFLLCISPNMALDKIMIKKLEKFLAMTKDNKYVSYIGTKRIDDPKENFIEPSQSKPIVTENTETFEDYDLSDEEDTVDKKKKKEMDRQKIMQDNKKKRNNSKKL